MTPPRLKRRNPEQIDLSKPKYSKEYIESFFKWISYNVVLALIGQVVFRLWWYEQSWLLLPMFVFFGVVFLNVLVYGLRALALPAVNMTPEEFNDPNADVGVARWRLLVTLFWQLVMQALVVIVFLNLLPVILATR